MKWKIMLVIMFSVMNLSVGASAKLSDGDCNYPDCKTFWN